MAKERNVGGGSAAGGGVERGGGERENRQNGGGKRNRVSQSSASRYRAQASFALEEIITWCQTVGECMRSPGGCRRGINTWHCRLQGGGASEQENGSGGLL